MQKRNGTRGAATSVRKKESGESWHKWVLMVTALAFALLVITLLMQKQQDMQVAMRALLHAQSSDTRAKITSKTLGEPSYKNISSTSCHENTGECLMTLGDAYYPQGLAVVEGYYQQYQTTDVNGVATTCDAFVITDGSEALLTGFGRLADAGSTFVPRIAEGYLLAKLNFSDVVADMTVEEIARLKASTPDDQAEVQIFVYQPTEAGAGTCQSPFAILEVDSDHVFEEISYGDDGLE